MIRLVLIQGNIAGGYIGRKRKSLWKLNWTSEMELAEKLADIETIRKGDVS